MDILQYIKLLSNHWSERKIDSAVLKTRLLEIASRCDDKQFPEFKSLIEAYFPAIYISNNIIEQARNKITENKITEPIKKGQKLFDYILKRTNDDETQKNKLTMALATIMNLKQFGSGIAGETAEIILSEFFAGLGDVNVTHAKRARAENKGYYFWLNPKTDLFIEYDNQAFEFSLKTAKQNFKFFQGKIGNLIAGINVEQYRSKIKKNIAGKKKEQFIINIEDNKEAILDGLNFYLSSGLEIIHISQERQKMFLKLYAIDAANLNIKSMKFTMTYGSGLENVDEKYQLISDWVINKLQFIDKNNSILVDIGNPEGEATMWVKNRVFSDATKTAIELDVDEKEMEENAINILGKSIAGISFLKASERETLNKIANLIIVARQDNLLKKELDSLVEKHLNS